MFLRKEETTINGTLYLRELYGKIGINGEEIITTESLTPIIEEPEPEPQPTQLDRIENKMASIESQLNNINGVNEQSVIDSIVKEVAAND